MRQFRTYSPCVLGILASFALGAPLAGSRGVDAPPQSAVPSSQPGTERDRFALPDGPSQGLAAQLEPFRARAKLPALAAAILTVDGVREIGVVGVRRVGDDTPVEPSDLFHLGSCTKSMTATLLALLVQEGRLSWSSTLAELFPDLAEGMHADFRGVTIDQLLQHRAGFATEMPLAVQAALVRGTSDVRELRRQVITAAVTTRPANPPGTFQYSNTGYVIAGAIAERLCDAPWETLLRERIFRPLGADSMGFGAPNSIRRSTDPGAATPVASAAASASAPTSAPNRPQQPFGHSQGIFGWQAAGPGPFADNPPALGPAGTVHASLADWARYAAIHLDAAAAQRRIGLSAERWAHLHTPPAGGDYACGWVARTDGERGPLLWHNGSNGMWYCEMWLWTDRGVAVLVATNAMSTEARAAVRDCATELYGRALAP